MATTRPMRFDAPDGDYSVTELVAIAKVHARAHPEQKVEVHLGAGIYNWTTADVVKDWPPNLSVHGVDTHSTTVLEA